MILRLHPTIRNLCSHSKRSTSQHKIFGFSNSFVEITNQQNTNTTVTIASKRHYSNTPSTNQKQKTALVLGSSGSLGSTIASQLKSNHDCVVIGSDIHPPSKDRIGSIDAFIHLTSEQLSIDNVFQGLQDGLRNLYDNDDNNVELDAIIIASGGFAMDETDDGDDNDTVGNTFDNMLQMNYYPVVAAGEIAKQYMTISNPGLFVTIGALAALTPAPGMVAYSSSKAAAHYYVQTLGAMSGKALTKEHRIQRNNEMGKDLRRNNKYLDSLSALAVLPIMLDTKSNREALPDDDFDTWTKPVQIADEIGSWIDTPELRPHSGSLIKVWTKNGETEFKLAR